MSQEAVEVVRKAFEGAARGLLETAETYWHPEVEYVFEVGEGLIADFRAYYEPSKALEVAGLAE